MKTLRVLLISCMACFLLGTGSASAQTVSAKEARIQKLLKSKNFTFVAQSANPLGGATIRLDPADYRVSFHRDSLNSVLPYFGTAFRAQYGATRSPLIFSSSDFTYDAKASKNGGQTIIIKIRRPDDPDMLTLSVSPAGYGTLHVNSVNRQPISFYGVIEPLKENAN